MKPFKQKIEEKRKRLEAEKLIVEEKAKQAQKEKEWEDWEREQVAIAEQNKQIIRDDEQRKAQEYLDWKHEQKLIREQTEQSTAKPINTGIGVGHADTWVLNWQSFSNHPDIINLPMSEKIRLFKLAEQRQAEKLNYYINLNTDINNNIHSNDLYWMDGTVTPHDGVATVSQDEYWTKDVEITMDEEVFIIEAGVTLTIDGRLTANSNIRVYGTLKVKSLTANVPIDLQGAGAIVYI